VGGEAARGDRAGGEVGRESKNAAAQEFAADEQIGGRQAAAAKIGRRTKPLFGRSRFIRHLVDCLSVLSSFPDGTIVPELSSMEQLVCEVYCASSS
jgi:hypothetical protein